MQDCNLVLYNGKLAQSGPTAQAAVWSSATFNKGTAPCTAVVSSVAGGSLSVDDTKGAQLFKQP